ncbi:MAG: RNA polymerase factor sigma-32 [Desulfovibrio sp.]|nr:RNA polymerase factor sigma-32 [Desulfovibrio sp.]
MLNEDDLDALTDVCADDEEEQSALPFAEDAPIEPIAPDESDQDLPARSSSRLPAIGGGQDSLRLYLREISRFPLLKPDEEHELALRVRDNNDAAAAFRLVSSHLRLVVRIAMDFQRRWMQNVLDLVQEGNVGLMHAVNKFDPDKGIKFSYYASFWIKAYILKFIMDNWRMVKIGTTQVQRKLFYNLNRERQKLIMQGFDPDAAMLSERLGVSKEQITEMDQRMAATDLSLNAQVGDDNGGATHLDFLPALGPGIEDNIARDEMADLVRSKIKTILPKLNEKELYILHNRLLTDEPVTLREIGERYNVTRERVRQLEARLLEKIRQHLAIDIKDFSDTWIHSS